MRNWGGNHAYRATRLHRPETLDELCRVVAAAPQVRVLGTRHAFSDIADAVVYLTEARNITGEVLHVDGGAHQGRW